jgi:hypothetical protein
MTPPKSFFIHELHDSSIQYRPYWWCVQYDHIRVSNIPTCPLFGVATRYAERGGRLPACRLSCCKAESPLLRLRGFATRATASVHRCSTHIGRDARITNPRERRKFHTYAGNFSYLLGSGLFGLEVEVLELSLTICWRLPRLSTPNRDFKPC